MAAANPDALPGRAANLAPAPPAAAPVFAKAAAAPLAAVAAAPKLAGIPAAAALKSFNPPLPPVPIDASPADILPAAAAAAFNKDGSFPAAAPTLFNAEAAPEFSELADAANVPSDALAPSRAVFKAVNDAIAPLALKPSVCVISAIRFYLCEETCTGLAV